MKPTAILTNTSRGPIVDQEALYEGFKSGQITGAGLDVTGPEPISRDDPLLSLDNCVVLPHIGSANIATRTKMELMAAENLIAGLKGEMLQNSVNPEAFGAMRWTPTGKRVVPRQFSLARDGRWPSQVLAIGASTETLRSGHQRFPEGDSGRGPHRATSGVVEDGCRGSSQVRHPF